MTDKERLEEIKKHRNEADNSTDDYEFEKINFYNLHVDWLIEQAERVQELEEHIDYLYDNNVHLKGDYRLQEQNKRYREAIEKGIKATRYTNPGVAYILAGALEGEE